MIKYIHIGYPKTLTSSLQVEFFEKNSQILHLGIGCGSLIDYIDDDINISIENYILYAKDIPYQEQKEEIKRVFNNWFDYAEDNGYKAVGISLEWLSFDLNPDQNDIVIIAERLKDIFGENTKILALIRNQFDLLKSIYGQYVREGMSLSFKEFIDYSYIYKERNFLYDIFFERVFSVYADLYGHECINFIPIEIVRKSHTKELISKNEEIVLLKKICVILNIDYESVIFGHTNPSLSQKIIFQKYLLNKQVRHDFGNLIFEHSNLHRNRKFFERDPLIKIEDPFFDVKKKRLLLEQAEKKSLHDSRKISYFSDVDITNKLAEMFTQSNRILSENHGIKLPDCYYKMRF